MGEMSVGTLKLIATKTGLSVVYELFEYWHSEPDHELLCRLIDKAIDQCAVSMAQYPKELDDLKEDQLTVMLIMQLDKFGLDVSHDTTSGGHCDIVIKDGGGFLWLGEVKKVSGVDNNWIGEGFDQLMVRYATGLPSQDRGGLILFCNCPRIDNVLEEWCKYLTERYAGVLVPRYDSNELWFESEQASERTGRKVTVRHKPISVYFPPLHAVTTMKTGKGAA
ncbi:hypothetical protein HB777_01440 [Mesorhizobium loti]|nr:hypothetical protein HB777_01440 [Mesorhizobium loti]